MDPDENFHINPYYKHLSIPMKILKEECKVNQNITYNSPSNILLNPFQL